MQGTKFNTCFWGIFLNDLSCGYLGVFNGIV